MNTITKELIEQRLDGRYSCEFWFGNFPISSTAKSLEEVQLNREFALEWARENQDIIERQNLTKGDSHEEAT